ncbi:polyprotein, partial [Neisseria gonorrhoeae]
MTRFICRPLPKNAKKMPSEDLSDG